MFWTYGIANSAIEQLFERADPPTLDEILKEPELLQELRSPNDKLINFLTDEENIAKIVQYAISSDNISFSNSCTDIIMASIALIDHSIFEETAHIKSLWSTVASSKDALQLTRGAKIFTHYASFKTKDLFDFFSANEINIVDSVINSINHSAVAELCIRFLTNKIDDYYMQYQEMFAKDQFMMKLIAKISKNSDLDTASGASVLISELLRVVRSENSNEELPKCDKTFFTDLFSDEILNILISNIVEAQDNLNIALQGSSLLCTIFNLQRCGTMNGDEFTLPSQIPPKFIRYNKKDFTNFTQNIEPLFEILKKDIDASYPNACGYSIKAFGPLRLQILEALVSIMLNNDEALSAEFSRLNFPLYLMDLFEKYPENNIIHSLVELAITSILMGFRWKAAGSSLLHVDEHLITCLLKDDVFIEVLVDLATKAKGYSAHINEIQRALRSSLADSCHKGLILLRIEELPEHLKESLRESQERLKVVDEREMIDTKFLHSVGEDIELGEMSNTSPDSQTFYSLEKALETFRIEKSGLFFDDITEAFENDMLLDLNTDFNENPFINMNIRKHEISFNPDQINTYIGVVDETIDDVIRPLNSHGDDDDEDSDNCNFHSIDEEMSRSYYGFNRIDSPLDTPCDNNIQIITNSEHNSKDIHHNIPDSSDVTETQATVQSDDHSVEVTK